MTITHRSSPAGPYGRVLQYAVVAIIFGIALYQNWPLSPAPQHRAAPRQVPAATAAETGSVAQPEASASPQDKSTATDPRGVMPSSAAADAERARPALRTSVPNQIIRDERGRVLWRGTVDLAGTLARIERQETIKAFRNDGSVFENRERRLPARSRGHYREWVHPTPGERGPGPQRVVSGGTTEFWYTPDHYRTFQPLHE
jgi:filamentous hemagglutinin